MYCRTAMLSYGRGSASDLDLREIAYSEALHLIRDIQLVGLVSSRPGLKDRVFADLFYVCLEFHTHTSGMRFLSNAFLMQQVLKANGQAVFDEEDGPMWSSFKPSALRLWNELCSRRPRLTGRARAASIIARKWRVVQMERRERAARRIQAACRDWIHKPITSDGKLGITLRLLMKEGGVQRHGDTFLLLCK